MSPPEENEALYAKDIMSDHVIHLTDDMTLQEAAHIFIDRGISGAPVLDRAGKLVGVLSETDLVHHECDHITGVAIDSEIPDYYNISEQGRLLKGYHLELPDYTRVSEIMTPAVFMVQEDTPIEEVAREMLHKHIHRLIVTRNGDAVGIITSMDLLRAMLYRA